MNDATRSPVGRLARRILVVVVLSLLGCSGSTADQPQGHASPGTSSAAGSTDLDGRSLSVPASRRIGYMDKAALYVADADGSNRQMIAQIPNAYAGPSWSEDANAFLIRSEEPDGKGGHNGYVLRVDFDGAVSNLSQLTGRTRDAMADWSPDGKEIVFISSSESDVVPHLFLMDADGTNVRQLTHAEQEDQYPAWSPDGKHIAFTRVATGGTFDLFLISIQDGAIRQLTGEPGDENWATWNGDSSAVAFARSDEIWIVEADGTDQRIVTASTSVAGGEPNWSRDSEWLVFNCSIEDPVICAIRPDGSGFAELLESAAFPVWID